MRKQFLGCLLLLLTAPAFAFEFSGYIDTSYNYLVRNHQFISGVNDRVNDLAQNGFTLQEIAFTLTDQPKEGFGGVFNALVGRDAYSLGPPGWNPYYGSQTLAVAIPQAFLQYARGPYTLQGGIFKTLVGEETFDATEDVNFSRSILDGYAEPGIFMGIRGLYQFNPLLTFNLGLNNGWSGIRDTSRQPTLEVGASYQIHPKFSLLLQGLSGEQRLLTNVSSGPKGRRNLLNLIATFQPTKELTLIATGDYGVQSKAIDSEAGIEQVVWQGLAGYVNYQFNDKWRTSLRGELYDDQDGYTTGVRQNWRELTLTLAYIPLKHAEVRAETRHDFSNVNSFMNRTGPGVNNNQQSYALEMLYFFDRSC